MAFFDKLSDMAKNIGDKTGDAIETTKLGSKIKAEHEAAGEELKKIGAFYYERFAQGCEVAPEVQEACQAAKAHYDAAAEAQAEIDRIKAENEAARAAAESVPAQATGQEQEGITCPNCGATNPDGTKFCCGCGSKLEVPAAPAGPTCPICGAANTPGTKFCCECGAKLEASAPAEPEKKVCPGCGTEVAPGVKFCPECGNRME